MRLPTSAFKLFKLISPLLFAGVFSACEEPVDPGFELRESRLVVSSTFFPDEIVKVRLSATQPAGGELVLTDITDAAVVILEGDEVVETLNYVSGGGSRFGTYQSTEFHPKTRRTYTLLASKSGYLPFEAESSIPQSVPISDSRGEITRISRTGPIDVYDFKMTINYDDPALEENFYDIRISQLVIPYYVNATGDTVKQVARAKVVESPGGTGEGRSVLGETSILVRDRPMLNGMEIDLQSRIDPTKELLGQIVAELRTVSEAYYDFHISLRREGQALPIGVGDPRVNSIGNARTGVGVFAGYSRSEARFSLIQP